MTYQSPTHEERRLTAILLKDSFKDTVDALQDFRDIGDLVKLIPEFAPSIGFDQKNPHHYATIDNHVFDAIVYAASS